jgi:crotonobetainyl-CoA:carnitine CoA-transferase CaiB-like acyl-CoA transferase
VSGASTGLLEGVRVADFSHALAGPLCSMLLADFGADVVKVERPGGDQVRSWGPPFHDGDAAYYYAGNRNKRSVVLDLKDADDRAMAHELVARSDVVVENSRPGVMARHGLDYAALRESRPDLVYCSITAFGPDSPELAGYDLILQAVGGIMSVTGQPDGEPTKVGVPVVDQLAGLYAAVGVFAALQERAGSGRGQLVEVTLLGAALASLANRAAAHLLTGSVEEALGNAHPNVAPYELFRAADRPFVLAAANEELWRRACVTLGRDDLLLDPRFRTNGERVASRLGLRDEIERTTRGRPAAHWIAALNEAGVPAALVNDVGSAFGFAEQLGLPVVEVAAGRDAPVPLVGNPIRLSRTPLRPATAPPYLDQQGVELRAELASARAVAP